MVLLALVLSFILGVAMTASLAWGVLRFLEVTVPSQMTGSTSDSQIIS